MGRFMIILVLLLALVGTVLAQDAPDTQYPADDQLDFPQDHYFHLNADFADPDAFIEWLYYTGVVEETNSGDLWGFQMTLFAVPLAGRTAFLYEVALSNVAQATFWHQRGTGFSAAPFGEDAAIFDDGSFSINYLEQDGWLIQYEGETVRVETGETQPLLLTIEVLKGDADYILHAADGLVAMGAPETCVTDKASLDGWSVYYSQPNSPTTMEVTLGDATYQMTGLTWFDHQWGNFGDCDLAWNWWGLRLDDGTNLILTQVLDEQGAVIPDLPAGAIYYPDGTAQYLSQAQVEFNNRRTWTNPANNFVFPIEWDITTPDGTLQIVPYFDVQVLPETLITSPYWEGIVQILDEDGNQIGRGYLEVLPQGVE